MEERTRELVENSVENVDISTVSPILYMYQEMIRLSLGSKKERRMNDYFFLHFIYISYSLVNLVGESWRGGVFKALKHRRASKKLSNNLGVRYNDGMYISEEVLKD